MDERVTTDEYRLRIARSATEETETAGHLTLTDLGGVYKVELVEETSVAQLTISGEAMRSLARWVVKP